MLRSLRFVQAALLVAGVGIAMTACTTPVYAQRGGGYYRNMDRQAYDIGYNEGVQQGQNDARRGRSYSYQQHSEYRNADNGYRREYGDRELYRQSYRQGFQTGYGEGYNRYTNNGNYGRYPRSTYPPQSYPTYPSTPTPGGVAVPRGTYGGYGYSPAAQTGYRDGLEEGQKDARDRRAFDPVRTKRYREGDHDYNNRYGSRDEYKREYRTAFEQGYRDGYGNGRRF
jgi:hypothetical protein